MSKTKHTPGPWTVGVDGYGNTIVKADDFEVATVFGGENNEEDNEYQAADARLIAAAPELLEALIDLYETSLAESGTSDSEVVAGDTSALGDAKAAIAKARGGD